MNDSCIHEWNSLMWKNKQHGSVEKVIDLKDKISSIVSMNFNGDLLVVGGMHSELVVKSISRDEILYNQKVTDNSNSISNYIDILSPPNGKWELFLASNDDCLRIYDSTMTMTHQHKFDTCVNHTTISPCGKMLLVCRDHLTVNLMDKDSGKLITKLDGHADFPFTSAWHPNGYQCATGAQDKTVRVWDIRKGLVHTLGGKIAPIRNICYNHDGSMLAAGEAADFVHIYDTSSGYKREQTLEYFGEMSGISFSPCGATFYLGIHDQSYHSLMEFDLVRQDKVSTLLI